MTDVHHQLFRTYEERAHIVRVCGIPVTIILSRISTIYCAPAALALTLRVNSTATAALFSRGCQVREFAVAEADHVSLRSCQSLTIWNRDSAFSWRNTAILSIASVLRPIAEKLLRSIVRMGSRR